MKLTILVHAFAYFVIVICEPQKPLVFPQWPPHNTYLPAAHHKPTSGKIQGQKTLVVQIRSDKRVPFVIKRPTMLQQQHALASNHQQSVVLPRPIRPIKMAISPQFLMKQQLLFAKHFRKPTFLKYKFASTNSGASEKPYSYEKPSFTSTTPEFQKLPFKNAVQFSNNHFAPIHTIPSPNLSTIHEYNIPRHELPLYTPPSNANAQFNQQLYQVTEEFTNDQTILDASGKQKYFAPDPDPSLPSAKIRTAVESYNIPSNGKPLPSDVQNNYLSSSNQAALQESQKYLANVYGLGVSNQPQLQQFLVQQGSPGNSVQNAPLSVYNPTYLVTQSKNLYQQHQKQKNLFKPNKITYANADLTQEVASDGQILQSAKDNKNIIRPAFNGIVETASSNVPSFAALIAAPLFDTNLQHEQQNEYLQHEQQNEYLQHEQHNEYLQQNQAKNTEPEGGFIVSNYFGNADQNPESYQEYLELSQRQRENDRTLAQANLEIQKKLLEQEIKPNSEPAASAYEEHQRLLQQQLGAQPLRIFVPDEDNQSDSLSNLKKRSEPKNDKKQIENNVDETINKNKDEKKN